MKKIIFFTLILLSTSAITLVSCGPVVFSSRLGAPPPWFYPNRVETVRYIYFPDHLIYYDLSLRNYIYLNNGIWITASILPSRFKTINLRRSRNVRINDYFGDNIKKYHKEHNINRRNSKSRRN